MFGVVVTSSSKMLLSRGIPILKTFAQHVDTFIVMDKSLQAEETLQTHGCGTHGTMYQCPWNSRSFIVLVNSCGGEEQHGCCRVFSFLYAHYMSYEWVAFVDDDVYVPACLSSILPLIPWPLFAPAKHVGARGGWRWSLCGDNGRPDTEIALPAGYGLANRRFVDILRSNSQNVIEQCRATPSYNFDVALSFASWKYGVNLTAVFDWTDPRVYWMGGQRHMWRKTSWVYHKVRSLSDFQTLYQQRALMCGVGHAKIAQMFKEYHPQTGYSRTEHARNLQLRNVPFDCQ